MHVCLAQTVENDVEGPIYITTVCSVLVSSKDILKCETNLVHWVDKTARRNCPLVALVVLFVTRVNQEPASDKD